MIVSYESSLNIFKTEWKLAADKTKELYASVIERMKSEHQNAIQRLMELKTVELQAVATASGQAR